MSKQTNNEKNFFSLTYSVELHSCINISYQKFGKTAMV